MTDQIDTLFLNHKGNISRQGYKKNSWKTCDYVLTIIVILIGVIFNMLKTKVRMYGNKKKKPVLCITFIGSLCLLEDRGSQEDYTSLQQASKSIYTI